MLQSRKGRFQAFAGFFRSGEKLFLHSKISGNTPFLFASKVH
jgi:hypothetical protein